MDKLIIIWLIIITIFIISIGVIAILNFTSSSSSSSSTIEEEGDVLIINENILQIGSTDTNVQLKAIIDETASGNANLLIEANKVITDSVQVSSLSIDSMTLKATGEYNILLPSQAPINGDVLYASSEEQLEWNNVNKPRSVDVSMEIGTTNDKPVIVVQNDIDIITVTDSVSMDTSELEIKLNSTTVGNWSTSSGLNINSSSSVMKYQLENNDNESYIIGQNTFIVSNSFTNPSYLFPDIAVVGVGTTYYIVNEINWNSCDLQSSFGHNFNGLDSLLIHTEVEQYGMITCVATSTTGWNISWNSFVNVPQAVITQGTPGNYSVTMTANTTITCEIWGAGGGGVDIAATPYKGGGGGFTSCTFDALIGDIIHYIVGNHGLSNVLSTTNIQGTIFIGGLGSVDSESGQGGGGSAVILERGGTFFLRGMAGGGGGRGIDNQAKGGGGGSYLEESSIGQGYSVLVFGGNGTNAIPGIGGTGDFSGQSCLDQSASLTSFGGEGGDPRQSPLAYGGGGGGFGGGGSGIQDIFIPPVQNGAGGGGFADPVASFRISGEQGSAGSPGGTTNSHYVTNVGIGTDTTSGAGEGDGYIRLTYWI
jgi:hypothetical protein